jgi:cytidylate kinase
MALITLTSGIGCGGVSIARSIADKLKLQLYDDQTLQKKASQMGLASEDVRGFDEKAPGLFDRLLRRKPDLYLDLLGA